MKSREFQTHSCLLAINSKGLSLTRQSTQLQQHASTRMRHTAQEHSHHRLPAFTGLTNSFFTQHPRYNQQCTCVSFCCALRGETSVCLLPQMTHTQYGNSSTCASEHHSSAVDIRPPALPLPAQTGYREATHRPSLLLPSYHQVQQGESLWGDCRSLSESSNKGEWCTAKHVWPIELIM